MKEKIFIFSHSYLHVPKEPKQMSSKEAGQSQLLWSGRLGMCASATGDLIGTAATRTPRCAHDVDLTHKCDAVLAPNPTLQPKFPNSFSVSPPTVRLWWRRLKVNQAQRFGCCSHTVARCSCISASQIWQDCSPTCAECLFVTDPFSCTSHQHFGAFKNVS